MSRADVQVHIEAGDLIVVDQPRPATSPSGVALTIPWYVRLGYRTNLTFDGDDAGLAKLVELRDAITDAVTAALDARGEAS